MCLLLVFAVFEENQVQFIQTGLNYLSGLYFQAINIFVALLASILFNTTSCSWKNRVAILEADTLHDRFVYSKVLMITKRK